MEIFLQNLAIITKHNVEFALKKESYKMGVNQFTDLQPFEVLKGFTGEMGHQK